MNKPLVNIGGNANDANHRYKREHIDLEYVARNGGMRRIKNLRRIIGQLSQTSVNVDAFEKEYYDRVKKNGLRINAEGWFKGDISDEKLEEILNGMIKEIILCPKCGLPEWDHQYCRSCGHIKKKKSKKNKGGINDKQDILDTTTNQEEEEVQPKSKTHLADAVSVMNKMYDLYTSSTSSSNSQSNSQSNDDDDEKKKTLSLMEKCMDKFWEIDNDNEAMHADFSRKMRELFPL